MTDSSEPQRVRLLSYNIQSGLTTLKYSQYLTRSWKHLVPVPSRMANLDGIARVLADYDIVGLQEVDAGSLRSGFVNQIRYLADCAGFDYVFDQSNRKIGMISQHGNAILSRARPDAITEHKLPGLIPGRGVLEVRFGAGLNALHVMILHMALGRRGRMRQIGFLAELVRDYRHVILMGDMNCGVDSPELAALLDAVHLRNPGPGLHTFPSWRPNRQLDHILVSPTITVERIEVLLNCAFSDHLPIAMTARLPEAVRLAWQPRLAPAPLLNTANLVPVDPSATP
jgi:endonuclease/exonuclease/phosphatase family metal-dependent hydrolase